MKFNFRLRRFLVKLPVKTKRNSASITIPVYVNNSSLSIECLTQLSIEKWKKDGRLNEKPQQI